MNQLLRVPQDSESLPAAELCDARTDIRTTLKAVAAASTNGDKVAVKCNSKGKCSSGRCKGFKIAAGCPVYCHGTSDRDRGTLCSLQTRTQPAPFDRPATRPTTRAVAAAARAFASNSLPVATLAGSGGEVAGRRREPQR